MAAPSDPVSDAAPLSHATPLRIARSAGDWVSFQLHREALERFVPRGSRVLEVSAGVGHYTEALHHLGCKISVLDESLDELESNQARARARGFAASIEGWAQRDICSLGGFPDASFDAVVAYGAVLSHALDRRDRALGECMRVLRPRGILVLDAFSLWGSMRRNLPQMLARDLVLNRAIIRSGNAPEALLGIERPRPAERVSQAPAFSQQSSSQQSSYDGPAPQPASHAPPAAGATFTPLTSGPELASTAPLSPERAQAAPSFEQTSAAQPVSLSQPFAAQAVTARPSHDSASEAARRQPVPNEPSSVGHPAPEPVSRERHCHLFRAAELEAFLRRAGLEVLSLSASSALSTGVEMPMAADPGAWSALLEYERAACIERGYLDSGHQLIAVARR